MATELQVGELTVLRAGGTAPAATLSETVDGLRGRVRVSGHLTRQGADLLLGTIEGLCAMGHSTVVVDMHDVQDADPVGLQVLHTLRATMARAGSHLVLLQEPLGSDPGTPVV